MRSAAFNPYGPSTARSGLQHRQEDRSARPSSSGLFGVMFVDVIVAIGFIWSIFASGYHTPTIASLLAPGAFLTFHVGLLNVTATGNSQGLVDLGLGKFIRFCLMNLRNVSLRALQDIACAIDSVFFCMIPTGCEGIMMLRIASYILVSFLALAAMTQLVGIFTLISLMSRRKRRKQQMIRVAYFTHLAPGILVITGAMVYLMLGGTDLSFTPNIPLVVIDATFFDLGYGFFLCCFFAVLGVMSSLFLYFAIPRQYTYGVGAQRRAMDQLETEHLIDALHQEARPYGQSRMYV